MAQTNTYQKAFSFGVFAFFISDIEEISEDTIIVSGAVLLENNSISPVFLTVDNTGGILQKRIFESDDPELSGGILYSMAGLTTNNIYAGLKEGSVNASRFLLSKIDENGIPEWSSRLKVQGEVINSNVSKNSKIYVNIDEQVHIAYESSGSVSYCIYDSEGNELNNQKIIIESSVSSSSNVIRYINECTETENGNTIIAGLIRDEVTIDLESYFIVLDNSNIVTNVFAFPDMHYELGDVFSNGDLLFHRVSIGSGLMGDFELIRVSTEGEIIWSKSLDLSNSDKFIAKAAITPEDEIIVVSATLGNPLCGIIKLDTDCEEIIWAKAHKRGILSAYGLVLKVLDSGNIIYSSVMSENNFTSYQLITKLNTAGELDFIQSIDFCINDPIDVDVEIEERTFEVSTFENDLFLPINTADFPISDEDVFINPTIPIPNFNFPSQLCITDCASATGVNNSNAQTVTWTIENSTPSTVEASYPGQVCFDIPGTHTIRQTITFNNCEYFFEREVEVIAEPDFELDSIQMLCAPSESLTLSAQTSEPAQYAWSTGETIPEIVVNETGTYSVTVNNEACEKEDETIVLEMSPEFNLPAQICMDNCTAPTSLQNENAETVEWYFAGAENEIMTTKNPGQICFIEPGNHLVRHTITFGNCTEVYETSIFVFPEINLELGPNKTICDDESISIDGTTFGADTYVWNNGNTTENLVVTEPGTYILTASNELCETNDTIVINKILPEPYPISLPQDTTICLQNLPFIISPTFASGENITWKDGQVQADFIASESGIYVATLDLDGCTFSAEMRLETEDCSDKVYIPNAFSPNNDGVNDVFRPEGRNFVLTEMRVYDRWGSLVYESTEANAAWNGRFKGDFVDNGVFIYVISYQNILLGDSKVISGDVSVLK